ncbi:hypothetical protein RHGRI_001041 [Rhododendron griersonianum]|uniref:Protein FAR1-RELATED SEQUENCE n=1 Tax=Rhododendron griersonianum TaxID=479676 RepID=A0AAV6LJ47_9ERIC|nr:hypothetical protein RHGRI_001041 [Rhododendron griersonianum]
MEEHFDLDDFEVEDFQTPNNDVEVLESPSSEMSFATIDEARKYYEDYGRQNGFWIRTRTSSKGQNQSNEVTSILFVCAKEGKYCARPKSDGVVEGDEKREEDEEVKTKKRFRNRSTVRCDCKAHLRIRYDKWSSKWKVTVFNDSHNHQLVTPSKRMKMRFVVKYDQALKRIVKRETDEDFESEHKFRIVKDNEFLLKHGAKVYTRNIFNKFKDEISEAFNYKVEEMTNADGFQSFVVKSKVNELQKFTVTLDSQTYEDHFILPRWRQKANKFRIIDSEGLVHDDGKEESEALRLSNMCQESTKLACLAAPSYESYKIYIEAMNDLSEKLLKISSYVPPPVNVCHEIDDLHSTERTELLLLDPNISQTKGRKKNVKGKDSTIHSGRLKSGIELALNKKKRKCNLCKGIGHDTRTCPENPMSKANKGQNILMPKDCFE